VSAGEEVGDALDGGIGEGGPQVVELARAGVTVALGDGEDGAVVLDDAPGAVVRDLHVGEIPVLVEDASQLGDAGGERFAGKAVLGLLEAAAGAPFEDAAQQGGVSVFHVLEQFGGERSVRPREQELAVFGQAVEVVGPAGAGPLRAVLDEAVGGQGGEVLAHRAGRDLEGGRELVGGGLPALLHVQQELAAGRRDGGQAGGVGGHLTIVREPRPCCAVLQEKTCVMDWPGVRCSP